MNNFYSFMFFVLLTICYFSFYKFKIIFKTFCFWLVFQFFIAKWIQMMQVTQFKSLVFASCFGRWNFGAKSELIISFCLKVHSWKAQWFRTHCRVLKILAFWIEICNFQKNLLVLLILVRKFHFHYNFFQGWATESVSTVTVCRCRFAGWTFFVQKYFCFTRQVYLQFTFEHEQIIWLKKK